MTRTRQANKPSWTKKSRPVKKTSSTLKLKLYLLPNPTPSLLQDFIVNHWGEIAFLLSMPTCIENPVFYLLINGSPQGDLRSTKGTREGDPLSPHLASLARIFRWFIGHKQPLKVVRLSFFIKGQLKIDWSKPRWTSLTYKKEGFLKGSDERGLVFSIKNSRSHFRRASKAFFSCAGLMSFSISIA